jgi:hypothetical protein
MKSLTHTLTAIILFASIASTVEAKGPSVEDVAALDLLKTQARQGSKNAQFNLAKFYFKDKVQDKELRKRLNRLKGGIKLKRNDIDRTFEMTGSANAYANDYSAPAYSAVIVRFTFLTGVDAIRARFIYTGDSWEFIQRAQIFSGRTLKHTATYNISRSVGDSGVRISESVDVYISMADAVALFDGSMTVRFIGDSGKIDTTMSGIGELRNLVSMARLIQGGE